MSRWEVVKLFMSEGMFWYILAVVYGVWYFVTGDDQWIAFSWGSLVIAKLETIEAKIDRRK